MRGMKHISIAAITLILLAPQFNSADAQERFSLFVGSDPRPWNAWSSSLACATTSRSWISGRATDASCLRRRKPTERSRIGVDIDAKLVSRRAPSPKSSDYRIVFRFEHRNASTSTSPMST